ncbi:hypothetical protein ACFL27_20650 [candidate division CSSED10-310 bacterium]|uniref:Uncharacterized protein n=1 Tax=candidate division CSSED10-310 bacterium TaxID=2855610 RepID=A0ABV6Z2D5_UNCC1
MALCGKCGLFFKLEEEEHDGLCVWYDVKIPAGEAYAKRARFIATCYLVISIIALSIKVWLHFWHLLDGRAEYEKQGHKN